MKVKVASQYRSRFREDSSTLTMLKAIIVWVIVTIIMYAIPTLARMDCLRNRDCGTKHEHLCNMQNGMWTKNFLLIPNNNGSFDEMLDSCSCCFLPDIFRMKASQRNLLESVISLESVNSPYFANSQNNFARTKPCSALRKSCQKTSDCCTGYCSVSDEDEGGFCNDPLILKDQENTRLDFSATRSKPRGQKYFADPTPFMTSSSPTGSSSLMTNSHSTPGIHSITANSALHPENQGKNLISEHKKESPL